MVWQLTEHAVTRFIERCRADLGPKERASARRALQEALGTAALADQKSPTGNELWALRDYALYVVSATRKDQRFALTVLTADQARVLPRSGPNGSDAPTLTSNQIALQLAIAQEERAALDGSLKSLETALKQQNPDHPANLLSRHPRLQEYPMNVTVCAVPHDLVLDKTDHGRGRQRCRACGQTFSRAEVKAYEEGLEHGAARERHRAPPVYIVKTATPPPPPEIIVVPIRPATPPCVVCQAAPHDPLCPRLASGRGLLDGVLPEEREALYGFFARTPKVGL